jgi:hypothetical protein
VPTSFTESTRAAMIYVNPEALEELKKDLELFYSN